jgi:uncharacterized DUF497 family protein
VWRCSWDPRKDALNRRKHGVPFAAAATVLDDPLALMGYDRNQNGEDEEIVRLISARHALRRERVAYEQQAH